MPRQMSVFSVVPQTQQLKNEVMHSVIIMIQEDLKPVSRKAECLGWEGNCFLETLKLCKMERGRLFVDDKGGKSPPYQAPPGLRLCPWVTFGLFRA